jgi:hypothetical protein
MGIPWDDYFHADRRARVTSTSEFRVPIRQREEENKVRQKKFQKTYEKREEKVEAHVASPD